MKKIIHYCWFGGQPLPKLAKKCIRSWKKFLPDYEIIQWSEKNFDINMTQFSKKAYYEKKWAFVSDVARIYALKKYGGLYFDTDMILIKDLKDIESYDFVAGWESDYNVAAGIIWTKNNNHPIIDELWNYYQNNEFKASNMFSFSIPVLLTNILQRDYALKFYPTTNQKLNNNIMIYTQDYFYPIGSDGSSDNFSLNTKAIHYYIGSWLPKSHQLRFKFKRIFGEKLGNIILNILILIKKILRKILKLFFYPIFKYKVNKRVRLQLNNNINEIENQLNQLSNNEYLVIYNKIWLGTSISTKYLFENTIGITELIDNKYIEYLTEAIIRRRFKLVIFSAFSKGWDKLAIQIKKTNPNIIIKVIWHGSFAMNVESYDWNMFETIFKLYNTNIVDKICFVKKSMYNFFKLKNIDVEFLMNNINIDSKKYIANNNKNENESINIGIYASGDRWVKNFYNQLAAASLFDNAIIDCVPLNEKTIVFSKLLNINLTGEYENMSHENMLSTLTKNDINLYTTFTECAPLLPLESMELGVPCITGNNHHYWQGTPLEKYLIVNKVDDCVEIYKKAKYCIENKDKIIKLYKEWKLKYDEESLKNKIKFLNNK